MAAGGSSPPRAPLGLLLLVMGVISSHLPDVQARPADLWCNRQARRHMVKRIEGLRTDMTGCVGGDMLPSPVQLPCVSLNTRAWANKTPQQKRAEVAGALQMFQDGVQEAKNQTSSECQTSWLEKLGRHIANYQAVVNRLQIQNDTVTSSHCAVRSCTSLSSANKVLKQYRNLLRGKLERLAVDLRNDKDNTC